MLGRKMVVIASEREQLEIARIQVVALACELSVLARFLEEDLAQAVGDSAVQELRGPCSEHRRVADELLASGSCGEPPSLASWTQAATAFRARLGEMQELREQLEWLLEREMRESVSQLLSPSPSPKDRALGRRLSILNRAARAARRFSRT
jgi:hypothetical protein